MLKKSVFKYTKRSYFLMECNKYNIHKTPRSPAKHCNSHSIVHKLLSTSFWFHLHTLQSRSRTSTSIILMAITPLDLSNAQLRHRPEQTKSLRGTQKRQKPGSTWNRDRLLRSVPGSGKMRLPCSTSDSSLTGRRSLHRAAPRTERAPRCAQLPCLRRLAPSPTRAQTTELHPCAFCTHTYTYKNTFLLFFFFFHWKISHF